MKTCKKAGVAVGENGSVYLTTNGGVTELFATSDSGHRWRINNSYGEVGERSQVRCEKDRIWFLSGGKGLQKSTDKGRTWELQWVLPF